MINNYRMDSNEGGEGSSITSKRRHSCLQASRRCKKMMMMMMMMMTNGTAAEQHHAKGFLSLPSRHARPRLPSLHKLPMPEILMHLAYMYEEKIDNSGRREISVTPVSRCGKTQEKPGI